MIFFFFFLANWTGNTCAYSKSDSCTAGRCNNGSCSNNQFGGYQCTCPVNYSGSHCQKPVPFCSQTTCKNNGICVDGRCLCIPGFEGMQKIIFMMRPFLKFVCVTCLIKFNNLGVFF